MIVILYILWIKRIKEVKRYFYEANAKSEGIYSRINDIRKPFVK